jgi:hypothetical protein
MVTQAVRAANSKDAVHIKDCMPVYEVREKKQQTWHEMSALLASHAAKR